MKKNSLWALCCACLALAFTGCANYLVYRSDFDEKKMTYYKQSLGYEKQIQTAAIAGIQKQLHKMFELCFVLYHRYPNERQKSAVLAINLRLVRLTQSLETFDRMQKNFQKVFWLDFDPRRI